jgi:hypothetical protein
MGCYRRLSEVLQDHPDYTEIQQLEYLKTCSFVVDNLD